MLVDLVERLLDMAGPFEWQVTYGDDSRIAGRALPREQALALLGSSLALYACLIGTSYLLRGRVQALLKLRPAHNLALALFSAATCVFTTWMMLQENHFASLRDAACKPVEHRHFQLVSFVFLASKVWEWFDTVLLVVKGSKLRMLHVLHHMTTFWLYAVDNTFGSSIKYGVAVNAFIHAIMYAHYYRPFPKPFRRLITQLQIAQFFLSIWLHSLIWYYDCDARIHTHFLEYITPYLLVLSYLVLFINFYLTQYVLGLAKGSSGAVKKDL